jgi:hypothetical protein
MKYCGVFFNGGIQIAGILRLPSRQKMLPHLRIDILRRVTGPER